MWIHEDVPLQSDNTNKGRVYDCPPVWAPVSATAQTAERIKITFA